MPDKMIEADEKNKNSVEAAALGAVPVFPGGKQQGGKQQSSKRVHYTQNRELSWLKFNERVLQESVDPDVPLLERLNFISIFSSNLQEFFMIRVGSLHDLTLINKPLVDTKSFLTPQEQLDAIFKACRPLYRERDKAFEEVERALAAEGIKRHRAKDLVGRDLEFVTDYAEKYVLPVLSPQIIDPQHPFPHLANGMLYIAVHLKVKKNKDSDLLGIIPVPASLPRVLYLEGSNLDYLLVEDIICAWAPKIFSMYKASEECVVCVTRNADINPDNEVFDDDQSYRYHMKKILKKRTRLAPVRLEATGKLSKFVSDYLCERLDITHEQVFELESPINLSYVSSIADKCSHDSRGTLFYPPYTPQIPSDIDQFTPMHEQVEQHDIMLCYPYESMEPFLRLVKEASQDPTVISIKITLYRLATTSKLAEYLIAAADNGKEVTVLLELRARFDEENNIEWAERFEDAGCIVLYGFEGYKVHTKICLITRHTDEGIKQVMQLATGNYNEKTAKQYCDLSVMTSDPGMARDAVSFFRNMSIANLEGSYSVLWVAPVGLRNHIIEGMDAEIAKAKAGQGGRLVFKMNSLTDIQVINKLVEASQAGVKVDLIIRGICCIVPGIPGLTDNITVTSIVGRFLEHARIYCFGEGDDMRIYLSSADMMTRNTERRVEIAFPLLSADLRKRTVEYLRIQLSDTVKARRLTRDGDYVRIPTPEGQSPISCQDYEMMRTVQSLVKLPEERPRPSFFPAKPHVRIASNRTAEPLAAPTAQEAPKAQPTEPALEVHASSEAFAKATPAAQSAEAISPTKVEEFPAGASEQAAPQQPPEASPKPAPEAAQDAKGGQYAEAKASEAGKPASAEKKPGLFARIAAFFKRK